MSNKVPAFLGSILLHGGLLAMAFLSWNRLPEAVPVSSVPVELVTSIPTFEQAAAPQDDQAVLEPEPEPMPEEPVPTPPEPIPAPKQPVQEVKKDTTKKPDPKKIEPVKPKIPASKDGIKKPKPDSLDLDALSQVKSAPPKSNTKAPARAAVSPTDGASTKGSSAADTGPAINALTSRLQRMWSPNCDVPGGNRVKPIIAFTISPNGRVIKGPEWVNRRTDSVWEAAAVRAQAAVKRGELYDNLPDGLYNQPLEITFNAENACRGV